MTLPPMARSAITVGGAVVSIVARSVRRVITSSIKAPGRCGKVPVVVSQNPAQHPGRRPTCLHPPPPVPTPTVIGPGFDVNGKYTNLIDQFGCAADVATYGVFNDYGWWGGGPYCGADRPPGYYVFYQGAWAIWKDASGILPGSPPAPPPISGPGFDVNGRYYDLIEQFGCAADVATYGEFNDYGWWAGGPYCGAVRPAGFYVFYQGAWAVWATATR